MKALYSALVKAQSQIKIAIKDSNNPHFRSKYADLVSVWDAVRDALHNNGLAVIQLSDIDASGVPVLLTRIIHESGEHIEGRYPIICKDPNDPQKMLAAVTYARRGMLSSALGVTSDDDDGNSAASAPAPKPQAKPTSSMADLFAAHKLAYPKAVEDLIGKPVAQWSENDKTTAREAIKKLQAGTAWSDIVKAAVFS